MRTYTVTELEVAEGLGMLRITPVDFSMDHVAVKGLETAENYASRVCDVEEEWSEGVQGVGGG